MNTNWKFFSVVLAVLLVIGFITYRGYRAFHESVPDWMRLQSHRSPALPDAVKIPWLALRHQLDLETRQSAQPLKSVQIYSIPKGGKQLVIYKLEVLTNPGFTPVSQIPAARWTSDQTIVGCYTLEGAPLTITLKHHPAYPKVAFLTVETPEPLAPGACLAILHAEQRPFDLRPDPAGFFTQSLPRLSPDDPAIQAVAISLPAQTTLKTYRPEIGAYRTTTGAPFVSWINSRLEARAPAPSATFKLP